MVKGIAELLGDAIKVKFLTLWLMKETCIIVEKLKCMSILFWKLCVDAEG